ncbi:TIM44-like domain-containing protein [Pendulispora albinea]|uniref:TIM44-like domain-containing protein n=1 Tax=Pendulispora albinea TaxID=2741071 RepID=A0ABZ2LK91_9BACT
MLPRAAAIQSSNLAWARPGGGQSFSSGGGGGGGAGGPLGGVGFGATDIGVESGPHLADPFLGRLLTEHSDVCMMATGALLLLVMWRSVVSWKWTPRRKTIAARREPRSWKALVEAPIAPIVHRSRRTAGVPRSRLAALRALDPDFSVALFEDFAYLLYAEMQRARAGDASPLRALAPFLTEDAAQQLLAGPKVAEVTGIVIGAMRITDFSGTSGAHVELELEFEASYSEVLDPEGSPAPARMESHVYAVDRLRLRRARTARSRRGERARKLDCPNCGAPLRSMRGTECAHCHEDVGGGRFDWMVIEFRTLTKKARAPLVAQNVENMGTVYPTVVDPEADARLLDLQRRDPRFEWGAFRARVTHVFQQLRIGWSNRDAARIRPYVSDNLFQSWAYWIDLHHRERCKNICKNAKIVRIDLANVLSDRTYDAITVRIFASAIDYTVSDDGRVLSGNPDRERPYSEYFTFLRGAVSDGGAGEESPCPHCGAPLAIGMVGNCTHCRTKVVAGEFDWVLSRIEQDGAYAG